MKKNVLLSSSPLFLPNPPPPQPWPSPSPRPRRCPIFRLRIDRPSNNPNNSATTNFKIAIIGFGNFGHFLAKTLTSQGHTLLAHSRSDYSSIAKSLNVSFFSDAHDLCEQHPDVIVLFTSMLSFTSVLRSLPLHSLRRNTLFADVLSVKEFPNKLLLHSLPPHFDIICTHSMFGPESGKNGLKGPPLSLKKSGLGTLNIVAREGCRMMEMSCEEHDENAVETQFLAHTVGRMLAKLDLKETPIDTQGYETLRRLKDNTCKDSFELYNGLFMYNKNATELLGRLEAALDELRKELSENLHDVLRKQLFEDPPMEESDGLGRGK